MGFENQLVSYLREANFCMWMVCGSSQGISRFHHTLHLALFEIISKDHKPKQSVLLVLQAIEAQLE